MRVRFKGDPSKTIRVTNLLKRDILTSPVLQQEVRSVHENIERKVKRRLLSHQKSPKSNPSEFPIREKIASNITTKVFRTPTKVVGGTGNKEFMDAQDPIFELSNPVRQVREDVRLWRILDVGTQKKMYLITPRKKPLLKFVARPSNRFITTKKVQHPGQSGFRYFAEDNYELVRLYSKRVKIGLNKIIRRYRTRKGRYKGI